MGVIAAVWAILGVTLILGGAIIRLSPLVWEMPITTLALGYWVALAISIVYMVWAEGYKGFHQAFAPRFAARVVYLKKHPGWLNSLLAPLFCMGYFCSTKRRLIISYTLTLSIIILVVYVHTLSQPWRGIIDAGVVAGLSFGLVSTLYHCAKGMSGTLVDVDPELAPSVQQSMAQRAGEAEAA